MLIEELASWCRGAETKADKCFAKTRSSRLRPHLDFHDLLSLSAITPTSILEDLHPQTTTRRVTSERNTLMIIPCVSHPGSSSQPGFLAPSISMSTKYLGLWREFKEHRLCAGLLIDWTPLKYLSKVLRRLMHLLCKPPSHKMKTI